MRLLPCLTLALLLGLFIIPNITNAQTPPKREFRGVWIATVQNIDWPSKRGLASGAQQQELVQILNEHEKSGINAIMLQIRPSADALYANSKEPWSLFLAGKPGLAPQPFYDPLKFAIDEAHKRAMELHAWFNPYRATNDLADSNVSANHITRTHPEWFFTYGSKKYFNPGLPEVRKYIISIIMDVVHRYDIDGVHFDDYFYPYPGKDKLPDTTTYAQYGTSFNDINDWRRHNVDTLIHVLSDSIHAAKKHVKFGISPFGIWRNLKDDPNGSVSNGLSGYSALYADARRWTQAGWVDYVNPQIYFPFYYPAAPYEKLLEWWSNNAFNKHVYIGQAVYRAMENREGWRDKQQLPNQVRALRKNARVQGSVYFSSKSVTDNLAGFQDSLRANFYKYPALLPQMIWLGESVPMAPSGLKAVYSNSKAQLTWQYSKRPANVYGYVIYRFKAGEKVDIYKPQNVIKISFDKTLRSYTDTTASNGCKYVITALDRLKNEGYSSKPAVLKIR
ncbi:family 10 glycosylhydrolase [Mucilaginibacter sp. PAMB04274]|uniref:glycoside hydrolase family 10 protein n=1 Tax=Mucilaginibacter sp. PAMB04274 TaxID=3138568 RepID=UPI0031F5FD32